MKQKLLSYLLTILFLLPLASRLRALSDEVRGQDAPPKPGTVEHYPKRLGLGVMLGSPTGLSGKVWMDHVNAWDFAVGSLGYYYGRDKAFGYYGFVAHADYLWHHYDVFGEQGSEAARKVPVYLGLGGTLATPGFIGIRGVVGVTYISDEPFDFFVELAPTLGFGEAAAFGGVDAGLGARYYFR